MPFPVLRDSDEESDFEGIDELMPVGEQATQQKKRQTVQVVPISQAVYDANQDMIKAGLRGSKSKIHIKFPSKVTIDAERFPSSTDQNIFVLDGNFSDDFNYETVDIDFPVDHFPAGFVGMFDASGRRWKCVPLWNGKEIKYIVNVAAEIRLCGSLFAGSTKGGKVRWDKAVVPNNLIPGKFGSFCVSDKVLLERRKSAWPAQLKQHQDNCNIIITEMTVPEKKKTKEQVEKSDLVTPPTTTGAKKQAPKTKKIPMLQVEPVEAPLPVRRKLNFDEVDVEPESKKRKIEETTYVEIKAGNMTTRFSSDDHIQIEMVAEKDGVVTRTKLFCN